MIIGLGEIDVLHEAIKSIIQTINQNVYLRHVIITRIFDKIALIKTYLSKVGILITDQLRMKLLFWHF